MLWTLALPATSAAPVLPFPGGVDLTDDQGLKNEGKANRAAAGIKGKIDDLADKVKDVINPDKKSDSAR